MKSLLKSVVFSSLIVSAAACGGDRGSPTPTTNESGSNLWAIPTPTLDKPIVEKPATKRLENIETPIAIPTNYAEALELGKELAANGNVSRAKEMFEAAIKLDKKQADPHIEMARLFIAQNERANAIKSANKAVKLAPESSQAYNTLGRAELLRHNYDNAIEAFRQATELNADNVWAWNNLGFTHLMLKKYDDAVNALLEATSRKGTAGYMWNNLGTAYEHLDQLDDARQAFENGGEMGSVEAMASRKRLEGVDTIVVLRTEPTTEKTYETREQMPEVPVTEDGVEEPKAEELRVDVKVEEVTIDEPVSEEPVVEEPNDEPKAEAVDGGVAPVNI